jgi:sugar phosphate isomerase/epimerase
MKIGLHSITYAGLFYEGPALTLEQICDRAAGYGYEAVEVMAKRPVASPFDVDTERARRLRDYAGERGLSLPFVAGYIDLAKPGAVDREKELVFAKETLRMARDLDAAYARVYAGGETIHPGAPIRQQWDWCVGHLRELAPYARDLGVKMALEIHTGCAQTVDALLDMLDQVASDQVVVVLDPPLLAFRGEPAAEAVQQVSARAEIVHAHIGDFRKAAPLVQYEAVPGLAVRYIERIEPVPLGQGMVELAPFLRACREIDFTGTLAFEVCTPFHVRHRPGTLADVDAMVEQAVGWLKERRAELG